MSLKRFAIRLSKMDSKLDNKLMVVNPFETHQKQYVFPRTDTLDRLLTFDNRNMNFLTILSALSLMIGVNLTSGYYRIFDILLYLILLICFVLPRVDQYLIKRAFKTFDFIHLFMQILAFRVFVLYSLWGNFPISENILRVISGLFSLITLSLAIVSKDCIRIHTVSYIIILFLITTYFVYNRLQIDSENFPIYESICTLYYSCTTLKNVICNLLNAIVFLFFRLFVITIIYPKQCIFVKLSVVFDVQKKIVPLPQENNNNS